MKTNSVEEIAELKAKLKKRDEQILNLRKELHDVKQYANLVNSALATKNLQMSEYIRELELVVTVGVKKL